MCLGLGFPPGNLVMKYGAGEFAEREQRGLHYLKYLIAGSRWEIISVAVEDVFSFLPSLVA